MSSLFNLATATAAGGHRNRSGYRIDRSVRLRASASAYFNRTFGTPTNNTVWSYSGWNKLGVLGTTRILLGGSGTNYGSFGFETTDQFRFWNNAGAAAATSTAVFRDPSAWYHVCVISNGTTIKAYINNAEILSYTGTITNINSAIAHNIGRFGSISYFYDGYLTEINFIDGQALTASSFGEYNTLTGVWQPKKYTGTYGTNGFYLNFSDNSAATAAAIGKDYSGNGNNWTPNNISVTSGVTYDSMLDVPTQWGDGGNGRGNYPVFNPNGAGGGTFQATNLQFLAATAGQWKSAVGTMFSTSGKYYWEVTAVALPTAGYVWAGAASSAINLASATYNGASAVPMGGDANGWGVGVSGGNIVKYNSGSSSVITAGTDSAGDVWMVAIDIDAAKIWFGRNGSWLGSGDPVAGTNAAFTNLSGAIGPAASAYLNTGATAGLNCGQRPFQYSVPSGYKALNTLNLP